MSLSKQSIEWAIKFIAEHADGDLFPRLLEIDALCER